MTIPPGSDIWPFTRFSFFLVSEEMRSLILLTLFSSLSLGADQRGQNCIPYPHDPTVAFWHMGDVVRVSHSLVFCKWFMVLCWFIILFFFLAWCQQSRLWGVLQTGRLRLDTSGLRLRGVQHLRVPTLPIPAWLLECGKFIFFSVHTSRPFMTVILFSLLELPSTVFWHLNH